MMSASKEGKHPSMNELRIEHALRGISNQLKQRSCFNSDDYYLQTASHINTIISKYVVEGKSDEFTEELIELIRDGKEKRQKE